MQITVRQLQAVLRDMGLYNMVLANLEKDPESFALWKKPAAVLDIADAIVEKWRRNIGLSHDAIKMFFTKASQKPGGPE